MTKERLALGLRGENYAATMLEDANWSVLARNVRLTRGEIDLIARDGDTLVFVEVKTLCSNDAADGRAPERAAHAVDRKKQYRLRRLAAEWLAGCNTPSGIAEFRFDVVGIEFGPNGSDAEPRVEHIEDAF